jgi:3-dehydroquinate synthase
MDPLCLNTLSDRVFSDGMAEVIKYGCIRDEAFFAFLDRCGGRAGVMEHIEQVLYTCCDIKRRVVMEDELDTGARMMLNFGHTLGHAYELAGCYETYTHGQAVAAGMVRAAQLGVTLGITPVELPERISALVQAFGLPTHIECSAAHYEAAVGLDKKGAGENITLILPDRPGHTVSHEIKKSELLALL